MVPLGPPSLQVFSNGSEAAEDQIYFADSSALTRAQVSDLIPAAGRFCSTARLWPMSVLTPLFQNPPGKSMVFAGAAGGRDALFASKGCSSLNWV